MLGGLDKTIHGKVRGEDEMIARAGEIGEWRGIATALNLPLQQAESAKQILDSLEEKEDA
jgi:hypothetical protein